MRGAVIAVDVLRAFTTAAYAFGTGAKHIYLVADVDEALAFKAAHPGALAMGETVGDARRASTCRTLRSRPPTPTSKEECSSEEARLTLALGPGHVDSDDVVYATRVDAFGFAMEVTRVEGRLRLDARVP